jgi:hypothetical protein
MYNLREDHDLQAKFTSLARKVTAIELKKSGQLKFVQDIVCQICETNKHLINDCPALPSFRECLHEQAHALNNFQRPNHNPYSQTYLLCITKTNQGFHSNKLTTPFTSQFAFFWFFRN